MARRALLVGIDKYDYFNDLTTCVADATEMATLLKRNADAGPNYSCRLMVHGATNAKEPITIPMLTEACEELFDYTGDVLFYFSGHGALTKTGGYIATTDSQKHNWGIPMQQILDLALVSRARDILVMLDCCHAGALGDIPSYKGPHALANLREDMTIIAASRASESAVEAGKHSLFTASLLEALNGGAADHMGWVTPQSIYAYVERGFGGWVQRPVYKSNVSELTVVRRCAPLIERLKLDELVQLFPTLDTKFQLDPDYEAYDAKGNRRKRVDEEKVRKSNLFKDFRDVGLVKSTSGEQFFWVALNSGTLELTTRGREYWRLVQAEQI